jgi:hypothetical protein
VAGYVEGQRVIPPITVFAGLFFKSQRQGNKPPWQLPDSWIAAKPKLRPLTPLNMVSDNDIIGGNSGSPLVNVKGEIVGLVFDSNLQALANNFVYRGEADRTISVHSVALLEALRKIYDAGPLADEITGTTASP